MKLPCPYCTENIVYDHNLAGKTIKCSYCQKNILMTPFDKLPPDYQQEYKDELEKIRKKQELEQKKLEDKRRKELEREEEKRRKELERQEEKQSEKQREINYRREMQKQKEINMAQNTSASMEITDVLIFAGILLIIGGIIGVFASFQKDITVHSDTYNIGLIADRHDYILISGISVVAGVISFCFGVTLINIRNMDKSTNKSIERLMNSFKKISHSPIDIDTPTISDDAHMQNFLDINLRPINDNNSRKDSTEILPPPIHQIGESNQ